MTFRYIEKSPNSLVRRTYRCDDCQIEWTEWVERAAPVPDCAKCELAAAQKLGIPGVLTNKSRAVDFAQQTAESMGLTDFNDNQRAGDIAYKEESPMTTVEREKVMRNLVEAGLADANSRASEGTAAAARLGMNDADYWSPQAPASGNPALDTVVQHALDNRAQSAGAATQMGVDPVELLQKDKSPIKLDLVARADSEGNIIQRRGRRG